MRSSAALCLLCLVIIGTVSAATLNTAIIRSANQQVSLVPIAHVSAITFNSSVPGATVSLDGALVGSDEAHSKTPVTVISIAAGSHTAIFRLSGYKDFTTTFSVEAGKPQTIFAQLQPAVARVAINTNIVQPAIVGQQIAPMTTPAVITHITAVDSFINTATSGLFSVIRPSTDTTVRPGLDIQRSASEDAIIRSNFVIVDSTAPIIDHFADVFIGEQGLDVTHALNAAYEEPCDLDRTPPVTTIGWWASDSDVYITSPSKQLDLSGRYQDLSIDPSDFVGYTGSWYIVNPKNSMSDHEADLTRGRVFFVRDPDITIGRTRSMSRGPVSGITVLRGDKIGFIIDSHMPNALMRGQYREQLPSTPSHGFINIMVQDPSGKVLTSIHTIEILDAGNNGGYLVSNSITSLQSQCMLLPSDIISGEDNNLFNFGCEPNWWWDTGAVDSNGQLVYPKGTYTIWAVSRLNNMNNNYKNGGQPYIGKTVSENITFTLE